MPFMAHRLFDFTKTDLCDGRPWRPEACFLGLPMRIRSAFIGFVAVALSVGCTGNYYMLVNNNNSDAYLTGDTTTFTAQEMFESMNDHRAALPSDQAPDLYAWQSSAPSIAAFIAPGRLVTTSSGPATLTVRSAQASYSFVVFVLPARSTVRATTHQVTMNVGDSVTLHADVLDSMGVMLPNFELSSRRWHYSPGSGGARPVVQSRVSTSDFRLLAISTGSAAAYPTLSLYRRKALTDTVLITVK